jgi:hypothetical protein
MFHNYSVVKRSLICNSVSVGERSDDDGSEYFLYSSCQTNLNKHIVPTECTLHLILPYWHVVSVRA